jgi:hypothetical protein
MVEVHVDWLNSYVDEKLMVAISASANLKMSSHELLSVRTKLSSG